jgi:hypothetical protein
MEFTEELASLIIFLGVTVTLFRTKLAELLKRLRSLMNTMGKDNGNE